ARSEVKISPLTARQLQRGGSSDGAIHRTVVARITDLGGNMFTGRIPHTTWGRRWWYYSALGILGLVLLGAGQPPTSAPPPSQPSAPQPMDPGGAKSVSQTQASPMDEPVRLIHEAQQAYQNVRDYTCLLIKRERINGMLPNSDTVMEMKVRTQPF